MSKIALGIVQETMLVTLWARAWDAQRPSPILGDNDAARIVRALNFDFRRFEGSIGTRFGITLRATVLESEVRRLLEANPNALVVELGAGLSSRFERLDNGRARWLEIDLPDALALRKQFYDEGPRRHMMAASVLEDSWISRARNLADGRPLILVAEGLLPYLTEEEVMPLLSKLSVTFPGAWLVFDSTSLEVVAKQNRLRTLSGTRARFSWGLTEPSDLGSQNPHLELRSSVSLRAMFEKERKILPWGLRIAYRLLERLTPKVLDGYRVNVLFFASLSPIVTSSESSRRMPETHAPRRPR